MSSIEVAAALLFRDGKLLITQRSPGVHLGGLWEFPGGKREGGETFIECLHRELQEELPIESSSDGPGRILVCFRLLDQNRRLRAMPNPNTAAPNNHNQKGPRNDANQSRPVVNLTADPSPKIKSMGKSRTKSALKWKAPAISPCNSLCVALSPPHPGHCSPVKE